MQLTRSTPPKLFTSQYRQSSSSLSGPTNSITASRNWLDSEWTTNSEPLTSSTTSHSTKSRPANYFTWPSSSRFPDEFDLLQSGGSLAHTTAHSSSSYPSSLKPDYPSGIPKPIEDVFSNHFPSNPQETSTTSTTTTTTASPLPVSTSHHWSSSQSTSSSTTHKTKGKNRVILQKKSYKFPFPLNSMRSTPPATNRPSGGWTQCQIR